MNLKQENLFWRTKDEKNYGDALAGVPPEGIAVCGDGGAFSASFGLEPGEVMDWIFVAALDRRGGGWGGTFAGIEDGKLTVEKPGAERIVVFGVEINADALAGGVELAVGLVGVANIPHVACGGGAVRLLEEGGNRVRDGEFAGGTFRAPADVGGVAFEAGGGGVAEDSESACIWLFGRVVGNNICEQLAWGKRSRRGVHE